MAQAKKGKLNYRCPQCFHRDLDIDMFYDEDRHEYYCLRCCYVGTEKDILLQNQAIRSKYAHRFDRVKDFGADNAPVAFAPYAKGGKI